MALTREQKDQCVRALRAARERIEHNNNHLVCYALEDSREDKEGLVRKEIHRRLGTHDFVNDWLYKEHGIPWALFTDENMRIYRLRWIDSLIEEYSND